MANNEIDNSFEKEVTVQNLPMSFKVKYIGCEMTRGLWGIKYTRRPVDVMVGEAKNILKEKLLPQCELRVSTEGVDVNPLTANSNTNWTFPIDTISYGVQDLVFTRVFAMIVVRDDDKKNPFTVHAFVCDSRAMARKLTFALAAAFQNYSRRVKQSSEKQQDTITPLRKKFAIDLRSPEELQQNFEEETEA